MIIYECLCRNACHICFFNLIREENKIAKKGTSGNAEKLENQLFEERCSRNKIIDDYEKVCDQETQIQEMWKEIYNKERISRIKSVEKMTNYLKKIT